MNPEIRTRWAQFTENYREPHYASADTLLKPQQVDEQICGHHSSVVVERGTRVFMFEGQANRDAFVNAYRQWESKPCQNPLP